MKAFCLTMGFLLTVIGMEPVFAGVVKPHIPEAKGKACVEDTNFMRRNHMELLKHHRDKTMRQGIRLEKYRLQGCLTCHAVYDKQQKAVNIKDNRHFCNSCHNYVAVDIDCFECHASTPSKKFKLPQSFE